MSGFVYFIRYSASGWVKVGYATSIERRLMALQCSSPETLTVAATVPSGPSGERKLHKAIHGPRRREWFKLSIVRPLIAMAGDGATIDEIIDCAKANSAEAQDKSARAHNTRLLRGWANVVRNPERPEHLRVQCRKLLEEEGALHMVGQADELRAVA